LTHCRQQESVPAQGNWCRCDNRAVRSSELVFIFGKPPRTVHGREISAITSRLDVANYTVQHDRIFDIACSASRDMQWTFSDKSRPRGDDHTIKSRNRKLIRVTSSNERLERKCVDLRAYKSSQLTCI